MAADLHNYQKFKVGDRLILVSRPMFKGGFDTGEYTPEIGSEVVVTEGYRYADMDLEGGPHVCVTQTESFGTRKFWLQESCLDFAMPVSDQEVEELFGIHPWDPTDPVLPSTPVDHLFQTVDWCVARLKEVTDEIRRREL